MSDEPIDLELMNAALRDFVPHNRALGITIVEASSTPALITAKLPWDPKLVGDPETQVLHGGVVTTLLDAACGASVFVRLKLAEALKAANQSGDFTSLIATIPYLQFLGVRIEVREGRRIAVMPFAEHLVGNPTVPALHGGTLGGLLESVAHLELAALTHHPQLPKTITLTIDYLRSGKTRDVCASAKLVKSGRRITTLQCHAWQEDENAPIATAMVILKMS